MKRKVPCDKAPYNVEGPSERMDFFSVGDRVKLTSVFCKEFAGRKGIVARKIKCHNFVRVGFEDGTVYDAFPENLEVVQHGEMGL